MSPHSHLPERLYVSHGAGGGENAGINGVDWFIVEPRHDIPRLNRQVESLHRSGRTVVELNVHPWGWAGLDDYAVRKPGVGTLPLIICIVAFAVFLAFVLALGFVL